MTLLYSILRKMIKTKPNWLLSERFRYIITLLSSCDNILYCNKTHTLSMWPHHAYLYRSVRCTSRVGLSEVDLGRKQNENVTDRYCRCLRGPEHAVRRTVIDSTCPSGVFVRARDKRERHGKNRRENGKNIVTKREAYDIITIITVHPFPNPISAKVDTVRPVRPDGGPSERLARTPAGVATTDSVRSRGGRPAGTPPTRRRARWRWRAGRITDGNAVE